MKAKRTEHVLQGKDSRYITCYDMHEASLWYWEPKGSGYTDDLIPYTDDMDFKHNIVAGGCKWGMASEHLFVGIVGDVYKAHK